MKHINTEQLQHLVLEGHVLTKETVLRLIKAVDDYQKHPHTTGPGIQPPKVRPAKDQALVYTEYLIGNGQHRNNNPILDVIQKQAQELAEQAHRQNLVYDPTSLQLKIHPEDAGNRVRLTATATHQEQS